MNRLRRYASNVGPLSACLTIGIVVWVLIVFVNSGNVIAMSIFGVMFVAAMGLSRAILPLLLAKPQVSLRITRAALLTCVAVLILARFGALGVSLPPVVALLLLGIYLLGIWSEFWVLSDKQVLTARGMAVLSRPRIN